MVHRRAFTIALLVLSGGAAGLLRAESTAPISPDSYRQLKFRYIGPVGNRVIAIAGVPGIVAGAALDEHVITRAVFAVGGTMYMVGALTYAMTHPQTGGSGEDGGTP